MAELGTGELGTLVSAAQRVLFAFLCVCVGGCFSGLHSMVPRGSGGGDTVYERRVSRAPLICLKGELSAAACDRLWVGVG